MQLLEKLAEYIQTERLFSLEDHLLLGVSGGKDSMLMAYLLRKLGYRIAIAHCNFQLRAQESDLDEALVRHFAESQAIPFYSRRMDTELFAKQQQLSIQMSARELRYRWFDQLCEEHHLQAVAIAHHQQDHIETVLINLTRGTGLAGLTGIAARRDRVVRPMLWMSAQEITEAVDTYQIPYRDDQSNFSNKYMRNKIRLDILPQFRELNPFFDQVMVDNITRFEETHQLMQRLTGRIRAALFIPHKRQIEIDKASLYVYLDDLPLLYQLFRPYQFEKNVLADLIKSELSTIGSRFESSSHILLVDRTKLFLQVREQHVLATYYILEEQRNLVLGERSLAWDMQRSISPHKIKAMINRFDQNLAQVDAKKLIFPLIVRSWQQGDRFIPLGMKSSKKISDFFIQQKIPRSDKTQIPLLINGNGEIIWVVGHRLDNRYRIAENTKKVATFVYR